MRRCEYPPYAPEVVRVKSLGPVIPLTFVLTALWMVFDTSTGLPEMPPVSPVDAAAIDPAPRRTPMSDPPTMAIAGYDQRCSACHALFTTREGAPSDLRRHEDLEFEHGLNNRCLNCHSERDRDKLVLHGEIEIGYDRVVDLCAKCHGPTWRDWQRGMHGRTEGSWETGSPEQSRLGCTQCHDPHTPAFPGIEPLPGPSTLRMGERKPRGHGDEGSKSNPLLRWMQSGQHIESNHREGSHQ